MHYILTPRCKSEITLDCFKPSYLDCGGDGGDDGGGGGGDVGGGGEVGRRHDGGQGRVDGGGHQHGGDRIKIGKMRGKRSRTHITEVRLG